MQLICVPPSSVALCLRVPVSRLQLTSFGRISFSRISFSGMIDALPAIAAAGKQLEVRLESTC